MTKTKLTGQGEVWQALRLGENEFGIWLYVSAGTPRCSTAGDQIGVFDAAGAQLIPTDQCWVAWWWDDGTITINVATPSEIAAQSVAYVDLELDLWVDREGVHGMVDEPFGQVGWSWLSGATRNALNVVPYDETWPQKFAAARDEMMPSLPAGSRVEHVGSTSVPGLAAKDCVDIAVIVPRLDDFEDAIGRLEAIGYEARRDAFGDDPGHVFIRRLTAGRRSHHVHLYVDGHPNLLGVLAFRDLLRRDPVARRRYQDVKVALADAAPLDRDAYIDGKNDIVQELLEVALSGQGGVSAG